MNSATPSELSRWLKHAQLGDQQSLGRLLEHYRHLLLGKARRLLSPELRKKIAPSDLVQDTCLEAGRDLQQIEPDDIEAFEAWLMKLLTNNFHDLCRRFQSTRKRQLGREREFITKAADMGPANVEPANSDSPDQKLLQAETDEHLRTTLAGLNPDYQQVIELRVRDGLTYAEIAQRMDRSTDAIRMLFQAAIKKLKSVLRRHGEIDGLA